MTLSTSFQPRLFALSRLPNSFVISTTSLTSMAPSLALPIHWLNDSPNYGMFQSCRQVKAIRLTSNPGKVSWDRRKRTRSLVRSSVFCSLFCALLIGRGFRTRNRERGMVPNPLNVDDITKSQVRSSFLSAFRETNRLSFSQSV